MLRATPAISGQLSRLAPDLLTAPDWCSMATGVSPYLPSLSLGAESLPIKMVALRFTSRPKDGRRRSLVSASTVSARGASAKVGIVGFDEESGVRRLSAPGSDIGPGSGAQTRLQFRGPTPPFRRRADVEHEGLFGRSGGGHIRPDRTELLPIALALRA